MARKSVSQSTQTKVLVRSRRRCALCFGLRFDTTEKKGQIAHLDKDSSNSKEDNLAFLCLEHHNDYDSISRQAKGYREGEVRTYRDALYEFLENRDPTPVENKTLAEQTFPAVDD